MELTLDKATAILKIVQQDELIDGIPTSEKAVFLEAEQWMTQALTARDSQDPRLKRNKTVRAILNIIDADNPVKENQIDNFSGILAVEAGLVIPKEITESYDMPSDLPALSDEEIRFFSGKFNAMFARARIVLAHVSNNLSYAIHLRDDAYRRSYKTVQQELADQKPTKDTLDSYAKDDEEYQKYSKDALEMQQTVETYKALVDIYSKNVDRLSREATMRHSEWERGR